MAETSPLTAPELLAFLDGLGIHHETITHPPVFTVDEAKRLRPTVTGGNCKSLFLRSKRGRLWLVVVPEDHRVDLVNLAAALGTGRLSFASPDRLRRHLGVRPGAVSPFAIINDHERLVTVAVAERLLDESHLNLHPLVNDQTTSIATSGFLRFLEATEHPLRVLRATEM